MTKTPDLLTRIRDGFFYNVNEKGEVLLYMITKGKVVYKQVQDTANIEQALFGLLYAAAAAQRSDNASVLGDEVAIPTVQLYRYAFANNNLPGHKTLALWAGKARLGFHVSDQMLGQMGKDFLLASAVAKKPN